MKSHSYYFANAIICKKSQLDRYSEWLFPILFELNSEIDYVEFENSYQSRVIGFIAERLLQVWVVHNNEDILELPLYNSESRDETFIRKNLSRINRFIHSHKWSK